MTWYSKQRDHQKWRGTLGADYLEGDGSRLTNVGTIIEADPIFIATSNALGYIAAESDPIFIATSNALSYVTAETDPIFLAASGALKVDAAGTPMYLGATNADGVLRTTAPLTYSDGGNWVGLGVAEQDPIFIATSDALAYVPTGEESDPIFIAASAAYVQNEADPLWTAASNAYLLVAASGAWQGEIGASNAIIASKALWAQGNAVGLSASHAITASKALWASDNTQGLAASHAIIAHAADTTDPHGAAITQTSMAISGDGDASGAAVVRNILIGIEATPGSAAFYTQGTIYMKYTA